MKPFNWGDSVKHFVAALSFLLFFKTYHSLADHPFDAFTGAYTVVHKSCVINGVPDPGSWNAVIGFEVMTEGEFPVLRWTFNHGYMSSSLTTGHGDMWGGKVEISGGPEKAVRVADHYVPGANPIEIRTRLEMSRTDAGLTLVNRFFNNSWYLMFNGGAQEALCTYILQSRQG
jgi:hypothetical protein